ncbi:hypothetical protein [Jannaschia ovalis]|uniref:Membrane domain of glycerophosphoryl diester phosphodiesterase n=1 Tax=Jannaschia ovalis TaxID=3038773 RepID=A0ABY8LBF0_9RHOB|nr:hypothetical protein [Jannaschia sp. GRR-S6-38]WGH77375.1 hypothetical protein P8627_09965 [Jannaschia sp. GRR-S6-38]
MLGWKMFVRAITLLLDNLPDALRVSAVPYALVVGAGLWLSTRYPDAAGMGTLIGAEGAEVDPGYITDSLLVALVNLAVTIWVALAWHRYVLIEERPTGWVPPLHGPEILGYLGRTFLIGLLVAATVLVVSIPIATLAMAMPSGFATLVMGSAAMFAAMIVFYRLAVVLPACAIGRSMSFREALEYTKGHFGTLAVLALLTVGFSLLLQLPTAIDGAMGLITVIYQAVVGWIGLLLGVSLLTVLYGHVVEGRPVD